MTEHPNIWKDRKVGGLLLKIVKLPTLALEQILSHRRIFLESFHSGQYSMESCLDPEERENRVNIQRIFH